MALILLGLHKYEYAVDSALIGRLYFQAPISTLEDKTDCHAVLIFVYYSHLYVIYDKHDNIPYYFEQSEKTDLKCQLCNSLKTQILVSNCTNWVQTPIPLITMKTKCVDSVHTYLGQFRNTVKPLLQYRALIRTTRFSLKNSVHMKGIFPKSLYVNPLKHAFF